VEDAIECASHAQSLALTSSTQPLSLVSVDTSQLSTLETAIAPPQPAIAPRDPALDQINPTSDQKTTESGRKPPAFFYRGGIFKDENLGD